MVISKGSIMQVVSLVVSRIIRSMIVIPPAGFLETIMSVDLSGIITRALSIAAIRWDPLSEGPPQ